VRHKASICSLALVVCLCVLGAALAWARTTFTVTASFTPDRLGAPTNLSTNATFAYGTSAPVPISILHAYGPAGLRLDLKGTETCQKPALENQGPGACPADSRIGFGGGIGLVEVSGEFIKEPFTFELFLAPRENGKFVMLVYVDAVKPVSLQTVLLARQANGQKPYGLGASIEVPPIDTVPGAALASVASIYLTVGSQKVAYYQEVRGHRRLVHVRGLIVPRSCPGGGFPLLLTAGFVDGSTLTDTPTVSCPRK
jgi:hypothetical protein